MNPNLEWRRTNEEIVFDRFTDDARKAMTRSYQAALRLNHEHIGTEHMLLGLVEEETSVAADILMRLGFILNRIHEAVEKVVVAGPPPEIRPRQLPFTTGAKQVLELALDEATALSLTYIGTEHILIGLIRERRGKAAKVLAKLNAKLELVRREVNNRRETPPP